MSLYDENLPENYDLNEMFEVFKDLESSGEYTQLKNIVKNMAESDKKNKIGKLISLYEVLKSINYNPLRNLVENEDKESNIKSRVSWRNEIGEPLENIREYNKNTPPATAEVPPAVGTLPPLPPSLLKDCSKSEMIPDGFTLYQTDNFEESFTAHIKEFIACSLDTNIDNLSIKREGNTTKSLNQLQNLFSKKLGRSANQYLQIQNPHKVSKLLWNLSSTKLKLIKILVRQSKENDFLIFVAPGQNFTEFGDDSIFTFRRGGNRTRKSKNRRVKQSIGGAIGDEYTFNFGIFITKGIPEPQGESPVPKIVQQVRSQIAEGRTLPPTNPPSIPAVSQAPYRLSRGGPVSRRSQGGKNKRKTIKGKKRIL